MVWKYNQRFLAIENIFPTAQAVTVSSDLVWGKWKEPAFKNKKS